MIAMSIPRGRILPILLIAGCIAAALLAPAFVGCLVPAQKLIAADAPERLKNLPLTQNQVDPASHTLTLRSADGRFSIELSATNAGCTLKFADAKQPDHRTALSLHESSASLVLDAGPSKLAQTSSGGYAGFSVSNRDAEKLNTMYIFASKANPRGPATQAAFACYDFSRGNPIMANAALTSIYGVGRLQLLRDTSHMNVEVPEQDEQGPLGFDFAPDKEALLTPQATHALRLIQADANSRPLYFD